MEKRTGQFIHLVTACAIAATLQGCSWSSIDCDVSKSGEQTTIERDFPPYTKLSVSSGIAATYIVGNGTRFSITMSSSLLEHFSADVSGDTLVLAIKDVACVSGVQAEIIGTAPLQGAEVSGGSPLHADVLAGPLTVSGGSPVTVDRLQVSGDVRIDASGGSRVTIASADVAGGLSVSASGGAHVSISSGQAGSAINANASGASNVFLAGLSAPTAEVSASGASKLHGPSAQAVSISASGASDVVDTAQQTASISCSGASSVRIEGGAEISVVETSGGCTVTEGRRLSLLAV